MSELDVSDESKLWEFKCPQFCDLTAPETEDQLKQIDHFFEVDHETNDDVIQTPLLNQKTMANVLSVADDDPYQTPPQNKENVDEENDVFYSSKKYLSVEKSYKLRATPMRTLQYNGITPLRETRVPSSKKKKKNKKLDQSKLDSLPSQTEVSLSENLFDMNQLCESLPKPISSEEKESVGHQKCGDINENGPQNEETGFNVLETALEFSGQGILSFKQLVSDFHPKVSVDANKENEIKESSGALDPVDRRLSYVIEKPSKSVTVVSPPVETKKETSTKKRSMSLSRRKGTPLRRSVTKISSAAVVARLYSTTKKTNNTYKSLAELLKEFETGSRGTDRSRSVEKSVSQQRSRSSSVSSITRPQSPKFHSVSRHRHTTRPTEDIIASEIKKYSFKANPIRKKLFDAKFASGIPRVKSTKVPTKAVELHFLTEKRHEVRAAKHSCDDNTGKDRPQSQFRANPMPSFKTPQQTQRHSVKKATAFRPFSFDDRIKEMMAKKRSLSEGCQPQIKAVPKK